MRALSDVPRRDLLGSAFARFLCRCGSDAADAGFDDAFIYEELKKAHTARRIPMTQLLRDQSLSIFSAWKASPNKIEY